MKKVIIFTTNSVEKLHPRIEMQKQILLDAGFDLEIVRSTERREGFFWEMINLCTLKYFKWRAIHRFSKCLPDCDIAHIYDLQLLPLAKKANKLGKVVIYETLDDNVHLNFFAVSQRLRFLKFFEKSITRILARYERTMGASCAQVIVNSPNLISKFETGNVEYIPYASPMEGLRAEKFSQEKESVFLYLGKLTEGKGSRIYKDLVEKHNRKLIFFGKAYDHFSNAFVSEDSRVVQMGNLSARELSIELQKVFQQYNVIGLSIILPENESYKWQEANKDIDYITMGIPFIGNDRPPTKAKIDQGCGALYKDDAKVTALLSNESSLYEQCAERCIRLSVEYSTAKFKELLLTVYTKKRPN